MSDPILKPGPELVITRILRAPRQIVWNAWSDPKQTVQWMGPKRHPADHYENDFRVGGTWRTRLVSPDGSEILWLGGRYHELVELERMVFTFAWDDDDGKPGSEMLITLTFTEDGPHTKMTLHQVRFDSIDQRDGHNEGWNSSLDRLEELLSRES